MSDPASADTSAQARLQQRLLAGGALLEQCFDLVWMTDRDWHLVYLSEGYERVTGMSRDESIGRRARDLPWFPTTAEQVALRDELMAEYRPLRNHRLPFARPDGQPGLLSISGGPQFDAEGQFLGYTGGALDISGSLQSEETLAEIARAVGAATGADYLRSLARALAQALGADSAFIGRLQAGDSGRLDSVVVHAGAGAPTAFSTVLAGTACAAVIRDGARVFATGVQQLFPADGKLEEMRADGYAGAPLLDSKGNAIGILAVVKSAPFIDATMVRNLLQVFAGRAAAELERQAVEAELAQSREYLLQSQRLGRTGFIVSDHVAHRVTWSDSMFEIRRTSPRPWFGFEESRAYIHPDDRPLWREVLDRCIETRQPYDIELRIVLPDGAVIWEHSIGLPQFDVEGRLARLVVFVQDVTERHAAEAENRKLALVAARTGNLVVVTNPNHDIEWVNEAFTRITGYGFAEALGRKPRDTIMGPAADPAAVSFTRDRLNSGQGFQDFEVRCTAKDGRRYWLILEAMPVRDEYGRIVQHIGVGTDVTAQKEAEAKLAANQALLEDAQRLGRIGYMLSDIARDRVFWSDTLFEMFGVERRPHFTLADSLALFHPEDRGRYLQAREAAVRERRTFAMDMRLRTPDGAVLWVHGVGRPSFDEAGALTGVLATIQDITEQKLAQIALQEQERQLREKEAEQRAILDNAPIAIFLKDRAGRYRLVNRCFEDWFEVKGETFYGSEGASFLPAVTMDLNHASDREVLEHGRVSQAERTAASTRAGIEEVLITKFPIRDAGGEIAGIAGFLVDVTARKHAEAALRRSDERFRALIEHSNDLVIVVALDGTLLYNSPSVADSLGFDQLAFVGRSILDLVHRDDVHHLADALRDISRTPGARAAGDGRVRHKDGSWRHIAWTARNATDVPGVEGIIVNGRDVTEAKLLEEQLLQSRRLEAVGRLAGGIAHDFNNIIGVILGFGDFLLEDLDEGSREHGFARRIVAAGNRAKDVVQQILAFARHSGVERRPEDLAVLVRETADMLRASLPASTRLVVDADAQGLVADVNAGQVSQLLLNLGINSRDALHGEPGTISVTLRGVPPGAPRDPVGSDTGVRVGETDPRLAYARITVSDTGSGMPPEVLRRIFDPFFTTKARGRGTGLGLAVVHGIVTGIGGICTVASAPGQGTRIEVELPLSGTAPAADAEPVPYAASRGRERILVVDDETDMTDMLTIGLERLGYEVAACNDPVDALRIFEEEPTAWDVVISDQVMPGLKGTTMLAAMRRSSPAVRVILCTGFSDGASEESAAAAGVDAFFVKPVAVERLAATIRRLCAPPVT